MTGFSIALLIVLGLIVLVVGWGIVTYNGFVARRQQTREGWSGIDVQLKRRTNLIPNLIETVKGYVNHERDALEAVTECGPAANPPPRPMPARARRLRAGCRPL